MVRSQYCSNGWPPYPLHGSGRLYVYWQHYHMRLLQPQRRAVAIPGADMEAVAATAGAGGDLAVQVGWAVVLLASAATVFGAAFPVVLPSPIDPVFDVLVSTASVSDYTLTVMTWVAGVGLPVVLGYQAWTYWVFRQRLVAEPAHEDPAHEEEVPA